MADGELFVAGRRKDLLIVNGRNIYPQDIEELVRGLHPALAGAGVAVSVDAGDRERLVVVHSVKTARQEGISFAELTALIKTAVAREFAVPAPNVVLVEPCSVHRTTSGKVQRNSMRTALLHRRVDGVLHHDLEPAPSR